ncbi:DUF4407 domain-containing protein [Dactylosporangium sucinum]|uniref:DUF4407 domain-containing protein n=1 Tax=Dactylosporangium sucinum TaxID=1424081 RepID=A0A917T9I0_9ACTN|nr:DUF4407 domain-containing protein [Dactylosporangium sucinum]GGM14806.1 hypothetical protein GCM10007977_014910 [Dactylosporangium sucinum]
MAGRSFLLRVANVNPANVLTHTDRALYRSIGIFILLYGGYAIVGAASFVDASSNYTHPWWQWLVGPPVAAAVIAYDRAVVGRVAVNYEHLESADPHRLLRRRTAGLYTGRMVLALLFAIVITEPLMLARYKGEIDAYLGTVHNRELARLEQSGAIAAFQRQIDGLRAQDAADDAAVADLHRLAESKRSAATSAYNQALEDSRAAGVSRRAGCPPGGFCDALVQQSRSLNAEATRLDQEASTVRQAQEPARQSRATQFAALNEQIEAQRTSNRTTVESAAGFGARTAAMWELVQRDFWGFGFFYLGVAALLVCLDCAAVWLKLVSHGNGYERAEARDARRRELSELRRHQQELRVTEAATDVADAGLDTVVREQRLLDAAVSQATTRLLAELEEQTRTALTPTR